MDSSVSDASGTADPTTDPLTGETAPTTTTETIATATLDSACVHKAPSPDRQGLTVHIAPGATVGYSTEYDDESNELTNPSYTTGFGFGTAGPDGIYRATWPVPANAPVGLATVTLAASEPIQESVTFTVAAAMGPCP